MAGSEALGASFTIDTTNLKAGLAQANRAIRESEAQFKEAAAGMDDWEQSAEGLEARTKHLNTVIAQHNSVISKTKAEKDRVVKAMQDEGKSQEEINKAVDAANKILNKEYDALSKAQAELKKYSKGADDAAKETDELTDSTKKSGDSFTVAKGAIAGFIANGLSALVSKAGEAVSSLLGLAESTQGLRSSMSRLETSFTTAGLSAEDAANTYNTLYGVLGDADRASEAAGHLSLLADNTKDLEAWTNIATGVYAQFGDSLPIEGLTEAANETAKVGDVTGVLADALNWAGVNEEDFQSKLDACSSEQERQQLITSTLNGLYSEQADRYRDLNSSVIEANEAQNALSQAQAGLGEAMQPLNTAISSVQASVLSRFTPAIDEMTNSLLGMVQGTEGSAEQFTEAFSSLVNNALVKITEILPQLGPLAVNIITTLAQGLIDNLPQITQSAVQIITMLVQSMIEMLPQITEAAIQIILALITGLADMIPELIPTIVQAIITICETLINHLDDLIDAGIELIMALADGLIEAIPILVDKIPELILKLVDGIIEKAPDLIAAGIELVIELAVGLIEGIPELIKKLPEFFKKLLKALVTEGVPAMIEVGKELLNGIWDGLKGVGTAIWDGVKEVGNSIKNGFKSFFGIKSPSKMFRDEIGEFMGEGMALGLEDGFENKIAGVRSSIVKSMSGISGDVNLGVQTNAGVNELASGSNGVVINQYNTFSQAHSRYELFKTKQQTAAAVRLAAAGGV